MILWTTAVTLSFLASTTSAVAVDGPVNLVSLARRRLEDADKPNTFLTNYTMNLHFCKLGETYINPDTGKYEYSSVILRLCPSDCNGDAGNEGCDSGYGELIVGLNTFLRHYLQANDENKNSTFDMTASTADLSECRKYETDHNETNQYFIGPTCSDDGFDIKMELFTDRDCSRVADSGTFENISNGITLSFSSGGLVTNRCKSCVQFNEDGEAEVAPFCWVLYEYSGKCEIQMEYVHESDMQVDSCEFIYSLLPKSTIMNIVSPSSLYIEGGYDHRVAQFGPRLPPAIELNRSAVVEYNLVYAGEDANYSSFCDPDDTFTVDPPPQPFILMIDRARCSFLRQVRHAQNVGAAAVLIADFFCHCRDKVCTEQCGIFVICQIARPIMADDGSDSSDIIIPSYLLNKYEADQIKHFFQENSEALVKLEIAWNSTYPKPPTGTGMPVTTDSPSESTSGNDSSSETSSAPALGREKWSTYLSMVIITLLTLKFSK